jgi:hypothetical protein
MRWIMGSMFIPRYQTYDCILVVGVKDRALIRKYKKLGAIFEPLNQVVKSGEIIGNPNLVLFVGPEVSEHEKLQIKQAARLKRANCLSVGSKEAVGEFLDSRLAMSAVLKQPEIHDPTISNEVKKLVGAALEDVGYDFNINVVAKKVKHEVEALKFQVSMDRLKGYIGQIRDTRKRAAGKRPEDAVQFGGTIPKGELTSIYGEKDQDIADILSVHGSTTTND